jgi:hypothetical protein
MAYLKGSVSSKTQLWTYSDAGDTPVSDSSGLLLRRLVYDTIHAIGKRRTTVPIAKSKLTQRNSGGPYDLSQVDIYRCSCRASRSIGSLSGGRRIPIVWLRAAHRKLSVAVFTGTVEDDLSCVVCDGVLREPKNIVDKRAAGLVVNLRQGDVDVGRRPTYRLENIIVWRPRVYLKVDRRSCYYVAPASRRVNAKVWFADKGGKAGCIVARIYRTSVNDGQTLRIGKRRKPNLYVSNDRRQPDLYRV